MGSIGAGAAARAKTDNSDKAQAGFRIITETRAAACNNASVGAGSRVGAATGGGDDSGGGVGRRTGMCATGNAADGGVDTSTDT